ncbi:hypothetical protein MMC28_007297 [Mycoblastus sanguinarius]|nr:hypothetical protein [Mycoblastus sanguinarius]
MQRQIFLSAAVALSSVAGVASQASTTSNPLNNFIGAAGAAASAINSVKSAEQTSSSSSLSTSSTSSTTPTPTPAPAAASPSHTAAASHHGLSEGAKIGIIVGAIIAGLLLLAIIAGICCCLVRRRHRRKRTITPVGDREVESWKSPINPGRHYQNYTSAQRGDVPMEQHPTVPLMAAAAAEREHHRASSNEPSLSQHPAMRQPENPFVPAPPGPRRTAPNSRSGLTDGMVASEAPYVIPEKQRLRKSSSRSRSRSSSRPRSAGLPTHNDANRPPTPFGLTGFGQPAGQTIHSSGAPPMYSGIGQPYEDMHVHVLQTDAPSRELRQSLQHREAFAASPYAEKTHPQHRSSRGYSTPPEVPSRSPNRENRASMFADSSYDSSLSTTTASNSSGERYTSNRDPYQPAQRDNIAPWEQHQNRFSNTPLTSPQMSAPPIPWEESEFNINNTRRQSHSPRQSVQNTGGDGRRRSSRSPATSINGQPRRLRFEDLQSPGGGHGASQYSAVPGQHDRHDSYDGYDNRWSQGVGEAL